MPMDMSNKKMARPMWIFTVPEGIDEGVREVGMIQLTMGEELQASKRAANNPQQLVFELLKASLVQVDGKPLALEDGTAEGAIDRMAPQVRNLVITAYSDLHNPSEKAVSGFLKSRRVAVEG